MNEVVKDTLSRALNTFAQTLLGFLIVGTGLTGIPWVAALSVAAVATLASVLQSVVRNTRSDNG